MEFLFHPLRIGEDFLVRTSHYSQQESVKTTMGFKNLFNHQDNKDLQFLQL